MRPPQPSNTRRPGRHAFWPWALALALTAALPTLGQDKSRAPAERPGVRNTGTTLSGASTTQAAQMPADQRAVLAQEGWPQTFRVLFYSADGTRQQIQREETWRYHDKGRRYSFLNGRLVGQGKADRFVPPSDYPAYRPTSFHPGMSFNEVVQIVKPREIVVEERTEEAMRTVWADRIIMGFIDDQLVYAETRPRFAAAQLKAGPVVSQPLSPVAPPTIEVPSRPTVPATPAALPAPAKPGPTGPVTVFADDFEGEGVTGTWLNWGSGYGGFKKWKVTQGAVDLYPEGNGYCVDLDGTWGMSSDNTSAGRMETEPLRLEPGSYRLEFRVKGNPFQGAKGGRAANPNAFRVTVGAFLDETVSLPHGAPWTAFAYEFRVDTAAKARLVLDHTIVPGDWDGLFIDDIKLVLMR